MNISPVLLSLPHEKSRKRFLAIQTSLAVRSRNFSPLETQPVTHTRARLSGHFITLEGIEGSGKTTQAARLAEALRAEGYPVLLTREPGGTPAAEQLRGLLLNNLTEPLAAETEAFIILAARRQHVDQVVVPAIKQGAIVLCDRFTDSTLAYQGYARGLDLKTLRAMNKLATGGLTPGLTLLFDLPVAAGLRRRRRDKAGQNRLDREARRFHERVRSGFLQLARRERRRIKLIDAARTPDTIAQDVHRLVVEWIASKSRRTRRKT